MTEDHSNKIVRKNKIIKIEPVAEKSNNQIIRKSKNTPSTVDTTGNQIIPKIKPIIKIIQKTVTKIADVPPDELPDEILPQIDGTDIISEYTNVTKKNVADADLSKEEMIEKVEYQKDVLIKNRDKYSDKDYNLKLTMIDNLLSKLKVGLIDTNVSEMNVIRVKIDKIVKDKKIPEKQFKTKIDLTGDRDDKDPSTGVLTSSRKFFENQKSYVPLPKELEKIAPKKGRGFGNKPPPADILKAINFS